MHAPHPHLSTLKGDKTKHFSELKTKSGIEYNDMVFFDDALSGKVRSGARREGAAGAGATIHATTNAPPYLPQFGNCEKVAALGVLACHTPKPDGLTVELFKLTLNTYARLRAEGGSLAQVVQGEASPGSSAVSEGRANGKKGKGEDESQGQGKVGGPAVGAGGVAPATVEKWFPEKQFGFIRFVGTTEVRYYSLHQQLAN